MRDTRFSKNNLSVSSSSYLRQHKDNPIWWQEWRPDVLEYAREMNKVIFVSVGYASCHWCHVMAEESFSDAAVAGYLNDNFISIKVDRQERPDIDHYLMSFISAFAGGGGWPLNAFLTPDLRPIYALTYAPLSGHHGLPGFPDILRRIKEFYDSGSAYGIERFDVASLEFSGVSEDELVLKLYQLFDRKRGGFATEHKFPPHSTLLFMLYYYSAFPDERLKEMITLTLDRMRLGGLHDHLGGGFFRYCVDNRWTIPHFEKMLYDQALSLWTYALAYKLTQNSDYKRVAEKIVRCLTEGFRNADGLYYSDLDADTDRQEGKSYLFSRQELRQALTDKEYADFLDVYRVSEEGNFQGKNHLLKKKDISLDGIEEKLLLLRKARAQPKADKKIITGINCLLGVSFIQAYRSFGDSGYLQRALDIYEGMMTLHFRHGWLAHSSYEGFLQQEEFLQDYAALLLLLTYLEEEAGGYTHQINFFSRKISAFKKGDLWLESLNPDFMEMPADAFDQPVPSGISLAELALLRRDLLEGNDYRRLHFSQPYIRDFYNLAVLMSNGSFHIISSAEKLDWQSLPINTIKVRGSRDRDCYKGVCQGTLSKVLIEK